MRNKQIDCSHGSKMSGDATEVEVLKVSGKLSVPFSSLPPIRSGASLKQQSGSVNHVTLNLRDPILREKLPPSHLLPLMKLLTLRDPNTAFASHFRYRCILFHQSGHRESLVRPQKQHSKPIGLPATDLQRMGDEPKDVTGVFAC
jgi:hypothetical protein